MNKGVRLLRIWDFRVEVRKEKIYLLVEIYLYLEIIGFL